MAKFETPEIKDETVEIPALKAGAMSHSKPYVSQEKFQAPLGFPGELVDNWKDVAINKLGELLQTSRA
ncbi:MAG: (Fe-S)-binding protein, partial [Thioalkalivibrio sp.]|nr:(Fe-S)-binding protein [Thioalkalivibrio sp.]